MNGFLTRSRPVFRLFVALDLTRSRMALPWLIKGERATAGERLSKTCTVAREPVEGPESSVDQAVLQDIAGMDLSENYLQE